MEDVIQLKKSDILKVKIIDEFGNDTGNSLEFDLEDIELPLKIMDASKEHENNVRYLMNQKMLINKKPDKKGKYSLSYNQEQIIKLHKEFYQREMKVLDSFLGDNACNKLLNGRKPYVTMFDDFYEYIQPILPILKKTREEITAKIKSKYSDKKEDILE